MCVVKGSVCAFLNKRDVYFQKKKKFVYKNKALNVYFSFCPQAETVLFHRFHVVYLSLAKYT